MNVANNTCVLLLQYLSPEVDEHDKASVEAIVATGEVRAWANCLCFVVDQHLCDEYENGALELPDSVVDSIMAAPGRYYKIGSFNGQPVFRQEPMDPIEPNCKQLYIGYADIGQESGWFLTETLAALQSKKLASDDGSIHAYLASSAVPGGCGFPSGKVHMPYWSKKPQPGLLLQTYQAFAEAELLKLSEAKQSYTDWAEKEIAALTDSAEETRTALDLQLALNDEMQEKAAKDDVAGALDDIGEAVRAGSVNALDDGVDAHGDGDEGAGAASCSWKGHGRRAFKSQTSGWYNRSKFMLEAWCNHDWDELQDLVDQYQCLEPTSSAWSSRAFALMAALADDDWGTAERLATKFAAMNEMKSTLQVRAERREHRKK